MNTPKTPDGCRISEHVLVWQPDQSLNRLIQMALAGTVVDRINDEERFLTFLTETSSQAVTAIFSNDNLKTKSPADLLARYPNVRLIDVAYARALEAQDRYYFFREEVLEETMRFRGIVLDVNVGKDPSR